MWLTHSKDKVKRGNSDTNFDLLGLLPPPPKWIASTMYCRIQQCHSLSYMSQQLTPNVQLLCAEDGNGHPVKNLLTGQFRQWHATTCVCMSFPSQHAYTRAARMVFGSLHHLYGVKVHV